MRRVFSKKGDEEERAILSTERGWLGKKKKKGAFSTHKESKWAGRQSTKKVRSCNVLHSANKALT